MWVGFFSLFLHTCLQIRMRGPLRAAGSPRWAEISVSFPSEITVGEEEAANAAEPRGQSCTDGNGERFSDSNGRLLS